MIVIIITILITKNIYITIVLQKPKSTRSLLNTLKSHRQKHVFIFFSKNVFTHNYDNKKKQE